MSFNKIIKRELQVAFDKHNQSTRVRIIKYVVLVLLIYFLWKSPKFWYGLIAATVILLSVHFFYRWKTKAWTKSFGGWKHELERKNLSK